MKNFTILSIFTISLLTSAMGFCSHFDSSSDSDSKEKQMRKGYDKSTRASLQFTCAKIEADCKNAQDKQKPRSVAPKTTVKKPSKPVPGSAAYALIKNKE